MPAEDRGRDLIARYVKALHDGDFETIARCQHPDFVEDYPQSGERIVGSANFRSILENYPGGLVGEADASGDRVVGGDDRWMVTPTFTMVRVSGAGDIHTAIVKLRYPDGATWFMVALLELRDGLIAKATTFFAPFFDPPEWRREWIELVDPPTA
jgi:ketosteroid isomerase-like protein